MATLITNIRDLKDLMEYEIVENCGLIGVVTKDGEAPEFDYDPFTGEIGAYVDVEKFVKI